MCCFQTDVDAELEGVLDFVLKAVISAPKSVWRQVDQVRHINSQCTTGSLQRYMHQGTPKQSIRTNNIGTCRGGFSLNFSR